MASQKLLGDVCEFKYGKSLPQFERQPGPVSVYGSNGKIGNHSTALTQGPTIVIGRKGSIGEIHLSPEPCWPIDTTYFVDRSCTKANVVWLYYQLKQLDLQKLNKAAAVPGLNRNDAYDKQIWVPDSIEEQRHIAAILDKADAIRRKRRQALSEIGNLLRASYLQLVSARNSHYSNWSRYRIEQLALDQPGAMRTGPFGSDLRHSEFVDKGIAVLGIDNAVLNRFEWSERRFITPEKYEKLRRYRVFPGDVIITIMGTTGRSAVIPDDIPEAITTKHLATITLNQEIALPEFISFSIHSDPKIIHQIERANKGAIMSGLNLGIIKKIEIALPPIKQQKLFVELSLKLNKQRSLFEQPDTSGEALFASLSQRAFRGEL
jgi:type I restriction enzyme, S subunit